MFPCRFSHRERQEEGQCDPVDAGPEHLPRHSDEDQSKAASDFASALGNVTTQTPLNLWFYAIKVRKGAIGAKCGLVFAYKEDDPFNAEKHYKRFHKYDSWDYKDYKKFVQDK